MIPKEIQRIFDFIDFLDENKKQYIEVYLPICEELKKYDTEKRSLRPNDNYKDKIQYGAIQKRIEEVFPLINNNVCTPITEKLKNLGIWSGDESYVSIKNNISSATTNFKDIFEMDDIQQVSIRKEKYISFRKETNSNFLSLGFVFSDLDEALKELFDFFKDTDINEFESFEAETIECKSIEEALLLYAENPIRNICFTLPSFFLSANITPIQKQMQSQSILKELPAIKEEIKKLSNTLKTEDTNSSYEEAIYRIKMLKSTIEDKGGFKVFKLQENQNEAMLQLLFHFVKEGSAWDINAEVNNGRGPVDFTVSKGSKDKTVIEFKLAKNSKLKQNLQSQVEVYKKANNTHKALIVILYFSQKELHQILQILEELGLNKLENIILIDGEQRLSASNVKT
ncbi:hypothetical protein [Sphingobacterium siyangense]